MVDDFNWNQYLLVIHIELSTWYHWWSSTHIRQWLLMVLPSMTLSRIINGTSVIVEKMSMITSLTVSDINWNIYIGDLDKIMDIETIGIHIHIRQWLTTPLLMILLPNYDRASVINRKLLVSVIKFYSFYFILYIFVYT